MIVHGEVSRVALLVVVAACISMLTSMCADPRRARVFDFADGRLVMRNSPEELAEATAFLQNVSTDDIPRDLEGSVVFDGYVVSTLATDKHGQPAWMVRLDHVYVGASELSSSPEITIVSPTIENGGVVLKKGSGYRILAVNLDGRLYTWNAAVLELRDRLDWRG